MVQVLYKGKKLENYEVQVEIKDRRKKQKKVKEYREKFIKLSKKHDGYST
jgi:hypothetical protein